MAGYTRQSVADIVNGENITAPPINAELNQVQLAFSGDQGHTHDGSVGSGPKIELTTSINGYLPAVNGGVGGLNNVDTVINPTELDDANSGYSRGSIWLNNATNRVFVCMDQTVGSAIWHEIASVSPQSTWSPQITGTVDLGSTDKAFRDIFLTGSISASAFDGIVGSVTPANVTGTTITATTGFVGDLQGSITGNVVGDFTGDIYSSDGLAKVLENGTDGTDANFVGSVTGDLTGDVTSTGTSTFGAVTATSLTATDVTATFAGDLTGNVTGDLVGNVSGNLVGDVVGNLTGNTTGSHTGPVDASNTRVSNVADPVDPSDALSLSYFNAILSESEDGIQADLDAAIVARDTTQGYMVTTLGYRNETEQFRDEAEAARDSAQLSENIAVQKAGEISNLYDSSQYAQRLIGSLI
jgi:hypothetical protein